MKYFEKQSLLYSQTLPDYQMMLVLCCDQLFSNIKERCLSNDNIF